MFGKKTVLILTILISVFMFAVAADAASIMLTNNSASDIHALYISSSDSDEWEENILEGMYLPSGNEVKVQIPSYKQFDLRVEDEDGNYEDYEGFPGNTKQIIINGGGDADYQ